MPEFEDPARRPARRDHESTPARYPRKSNRRPRLNRPDHPVEALRRAVRDRQNAAAKGLPHRHLTPPTAWTCQQRTAVGPSLPSVLTGTARHHSARGTPPLKILVWFLVAKGSTSLLTPVNNRFNDRYVVSRGVPTVSTPHRSNTTSNKQSPLYSLPRSASSISSKVLSPSLDPGISTSSELSSVDSSSDSLSVDSSV